MQEILYIIALSIGSFLAILILTKLMGYREMSQLSMFDYINSITIGSIAAEMATSLEENFMEPLVALIVYSLATIFFALLTSKSIKMRRCIEGRPLILMSNGELYRDNLKKAKIDIGEFLTQCRVNGYFDVSKLETVVLEGNGKMSFLLKVSDRPVTPSDMDLSPEQDYLVANVILDGVILEKNLHHTGNDEKWLRNQIKRQGADRIEDILLATCDSNNQITVFMKNSRKQVDDISM